MMMNNIGNAETIHKQPQGRASVSSTYGSAEVVHENYPYRTYVKSGIALLENPEPTAGATTLNVFFKEPFPHKCISVVGTPYVNYQTGNYMHSVVITGIDSAGFKAVYKRSATNGNIESTNQGKFLWMAFGY